MKKDLKKETLEKIKKDNIKIRPKSYFKIIKGSVYALLLTLMLVAIYVFNIIFYLPVRSLRFAERAGIKEYLLLFPWPLLIIGALVVTFLIYIYRNYDGGYKKPISVIILLIFGSILVISGSLANSNFNQKIEERPGFRRMYQWQEDNFVPQRQRRRYRMLEEEKPDCLRETKLQPEAELEASPQPLR
ncbi:hypothetical protein K0A96_02410 [Patescibacteria group bacterium]|nr:hypothetical protein [Patescibacteria group bacterium]